MPNPKKIKGRVFLTSTNEGIPNLLVEASTLISNSTNPLYILGSEATDPDGKFTIEIENREIEINPADGGDPVSIELGRDVTNLTLKVKTPDENTETGGNVLYSSTENDGLTGGDNQHLIGISEQSLTESGITLPGLGESPEGFVADLQADISRANQLKFQVQNVLRQQINGERQKEQEKDQNFIKPFCNGISKVPAALQNSQFNFVKPGESVEEKTRLNIINKLTTVYNNDSTVNRPTVKGTIHLTEEQKSELFNEANQNEEGEYEISEEKSVEILESVLKNRDDESVELRFRHPLEKYCREKTAPEKECLLLLGLGQEESDDTIIENEEESTENEIEPANSDRDVPLYVAKQMQHAGTPEGPVLFGIGNRATLKEIQENVKNLQLGTSPADTPSYFDFHTVQLAFEHVWQEAIDEGVLNLAGDLYDQVVELGGTPPTPNGDAIKMNTLKKEVRIIKRRSPVRSRDLEITTEITREFPEAKRTWSKLDYSEKKQLARFANEITKYRKGLKGYPNSSSQWRESYNKIKGYQKRGEKLIAAAKKPPRSRDKSPNRPTVNGNKPDQGHHQKDINELLTELEEHLKQDNYSFTVFAANGKERSVNFGLLVTYRQKWEPVAYQAGELIKTIPLAPKEVRRYSKKTVVKKTRTKKEIENSLQILKTDSSETGRAESEIMEKATQSSAFTKNAKSSGGVVDGVGFSSENTTNFTGNVSRESRDLKKNFRENVFKAAQEYKNERKLEITTEESFENEFTESGEISNPNDELTVTYLFYELQRRYKVTERIHRLRPVVFVAQEMPMPNELDEEWLIRHDWIIRRVLLDDSFTFALSALSTTVSDEFVLQELEDDLRRQRKLVDDIRTSYERLASITESRFKGLQKAIDSQADVVEDRDVWDDWGMAGDVLDLGESIIEGVGSWLGFGGDDPKEAARIRREGAMESFQRAERQKKELLAQLKAESDRLSQIGDKHNQKLKEKLDKEVQIARLKVHIKQNILHYMHAIWSHEHPDQRFFRLHNVRVPNLEGNLQLQISGEENGDTLATHYTPGSSRHQFKVKTNIATDFTSLEEVADLDNLLGFKGNYMIFPLKASNTLTDFMMAPYVDAELGLKDPDEFGNWTLDEFVKYVCCLQEALPEADFQQLIPELTEHYKKLLLDPLRQGEELVIPTGSLFIEALPGSHPILEDFKLVHRVIDVKKVQAEVREMELENARLAARLLEGERDDPDVEKKIIVEGNGVQTSVDIGNS